MDLRSIGPVVAVALSLVSAPATAAMCGPQADVDAVGRAAVADVQKRLGVRTNAGDLYAVQVAGRYASAVVSPPNGMIALYYAKRRGVWRRADESAIPASARRALFPGGDYATCRNANYRNRGASG